MIEVLFGESETGAMRCAKSNRRILNRNDGPTSVFGNPSLLPPRHTKEWESVPGTPDEVICLSYHLDMGNIRAACDSSERKAFIMRMYTQSGWEDSAEYERQLKEGIERGAQEIGRLKKFLDAGEDIRIWYSDAPYSLCGLYWLCSRLAEIKNAVYTVKLPSYVEEEGEIQCFQSWGEMEAERFGSFLTLQKQMTENVRRTFASEWRELEKENSPLRAVIGGRLISVPEDFYDFLIWKALPDEPIKQARLIGNILGRYQIAVGDFWYAHRIDELIRQGQIEVTVDSRQKYTRMICRARGTV